MKNRRTTTGNRRKGGAVAGRQHLLEVNLRTASLKRQRRGKASSMLWKVSAAVIMTALLAAGLRFASLKFFFKNPQYDLKHLVTRLNGVMTQDELKSITGFEEGKNIFSLDLEQANQKLASLPEVRSVSIERTLPDTIEVGLEPREPIFLLAAPGDANTGESFIPGKSFLCDKDGVVMRPARLDDKYLRLPVLRGVPTSDAVPGKKFDNPSLVTALMLRQALSELPEETFRISSIDVTKPYAAVVTDSSNAKFTFGTLGESDLPSQLDRLRKLLDHCQETGRRIQSANLMVSRNTPVTFVLTPERGADKIAPVSPAKKTAKHN
jgi:cell division septal protein FtsQ